MGHTNTTSLKHVPFLGFHRLEFLSECLAENCAEL